MTRRCEALSYTYFPCLGTARYVVSAQVPLEAEQPRLCLTHAKVMLSKGMVPDGGIYSKAPDGPGGVVVRGSQGARRNRKSTAADVRSLVRAPYCPLVQR